MDGVFLIQKITMPLNIPNAKLMSLLNDDVRYSKENLMFQGQLRTLVAAVILGGHLIVFFSALLLGVFGPMGGLDVLQTILMTSPVLGATALTALLFVMRGQVFIATGQRVTLIFA